MDYDSFTAYFKNTPISKSVWTAEPLRLAFSYLMPVVVQIKTQLYKYNRFISLTLSGM